ncbi:uncharacterized protein LOC111373420 [Olea europaea var. sylvestris]|uniref:uncharacterized protein LOC111373420 n=1 Tax=Olea europaea var. sylvestris TaxID=158386 RepID=UPI000C1D7393|nr:uncharacterized protein LOC111373420 [Olea europaea var. sylvestris]
MSRKLSGCMEFQLLSSQIEIQGLLPNFRRAYKKLLGQSSWESFLSLVAFGYNNNFQATIGMAPYEALYVQAVDKIRDKIKSAQDRHESYSNLKRKSVEFEVGEKVFLKVALIKGFLRFGKKGKLKPRFIRPFEILERIRNVAYRLALPPRLSAVHNVFHVSMFRKYVHDPKHVISYDSLEVPKDLTYEEAPMEIIERKVHALRNTEEATWEKEKEIRAKYPQLFN